MTTPPTDAGPDDPRPWLRRQATAIGAALVVALALALYLHKQRQATPDPGPAGAADRPGALASLRIMTTWNQPFRAAFDDLLAAFMAAHPDVAIRQDPVPASGTGNVQDMVKMQLAAGAPPDLFVSAAGEWAGPFIDAGHIEPLDEVYVARGWHDRFIPWAVESLRRDGKLWGVPYATRGVAFWYRTDLLAELGLPPPETYAQLEALCRALKAARRHCLSIGGKFGWGTMRLLDYFLELRAGPALHDRLNRLEARWDAPEVVAAYETLRRWIDQGWIAPGFLLLSPNDARIPWYRGHAALVLEGDWMESVLKDNEQDLDRYAFFVPPTDHAPARLGGFPQQVLLTRRSKHKEAALRFLDWYTSRPVQDRYMARLAHSTATRGVLPDPAVWRNQHRFRQVLMDHEVYLPSDQIFKAELMDVWFAVQDAVIAGTLAPSAAAARLQAATDALRGRPAAPAGGAP
jgi:raffinose/stachyose/melibiose transport system substrate-binding protein